MRITGGRARGRVLKGRVGPGVRPTSARVREALFSMVGQDLSGQRVLDAFGGSGLLGLEAWSRGAEVVVVEKRAATARAIRDAARALGADVEVVIGDVTRRLDGLGPFHGVLADPPYAMDPDTLLPTLGAAANEWLVFEADAKRVAPPRAAALVLDRERRFGSSVLWIYRPEEGT